MPLKIYLILLAASTLGAVGQIFLKLGASGREHFTSFLNVWIFVGLFSYGLGTALWIYSLSKAKLTLIYPFTALTFVLVYLAGAMFLDEPMTIKDLLGVVLVLGGLFLISTT